MARSRTALPEFDVAANAAGLRVDGWANRQIVLRLSLDSDLIHSLSTAHTRPLGKFHVARYLLDEAVARASVLNGQAHPNPMAR
ncbi:unnamed protein product [Parascedosporium putredinis]|uniref:Uncharacterized protein n=1 Tax=Parascedosporium putredinis TaxID=1442378 RepID=A0A9P1H404_9PEZI|nr:unnamed protein product [Parascedosporium putredinis]CAI7995210.1 unnamed protein product [Parascedosporium putredinis]